MITHFFSSLFSLKFFLKNWWVIAFIVMAFALFLQTFHNKNQLIYKLAQKIECLEKEKNKALKENQELLSRKEGYSDIHQMELILKERLGVVAEGEVKVVFKE